MDPRTTKTLSYFESQSVSRQWAPFLDALGSVLTEQMPSRDLRAFMRALGKRMAAQLPLAEVDTLDDLQQCMNDNWSALSWGWVQLVEEESFISIEHCAAPLLGMFGQDSVEWTPALLEGLYAEWFREFGAGDPLILAQVGSAPVSAAQPLQFRLGHPSAFD